MHKRFLKQKGLKILKISLILFISSMMIKCHNDDATGNAEDENQNQISEEVLVELERMGFNTKKHPIQVYKNGYIVEGDIIISQDLFKQFGLHSAKQRYTSEDGLVACRLAKKIKIKNSLPNGTPKKAVAGAIKNWNNVSGSFLKFVLVDNNEDIIIKGDKGVLFKDFAGAADIPFDSKAGKEMIINLDFKSRGRSMNLEEWRTTIEHELGHSIGFEHTDDKRFGRLVPGTPVKDNNSLMLTSQFVPWNLSEGDKKALRKMYGPGNNLCSKS
ncbi:zinc metalloprotease [Aquimarina algicola]|uniref:Matrixin family metalloprotease n=1 Tax=Aquimarina algicola TaxID=2589995 RepID=A0A504JD47_9FLAO|nr:M57 family metalloprotease [Aquimarina algicola]TPN88787.1 hypothetical protein FHK87_00820 [Aquimarina algicola]